MSQAFSLKTVGLDHVARRISQVLPEESLKELAATTKENAQKFLSQQQSNAPFGTGPGWGGYPAGTLKSQLKIRYSEKGLSARIGLIGSYARGFIGRFLDFGVKLHTIMAKSKALSLGNGKFAKQVMHPGIKARHWMLNASEESMRQQMIQSYGDAMRRALEQASNK